MKAIRRPDQYLRLRGDIWHYVRRVPKAVSHIDDRTLIYRSLDTDSRKVARQRRDICAGRPKHTGPCDGYIVSLGVWPCSRF